MDADGADVRRHDQLDHAGWHLALALALMFASSYGWLFYTALGLILVCIRSESWAAVLLTTILASIANVDLLLPQVGAPYLRFVPILLVSAHQAAMWFRTRSLDRTSLIWLPFVALAGASLVFAEATEPASVLRFMAWVLGPIAAIGLASSSWLTREAFGDAALQAWKAIVVLCLLVAPLEVSRLPDVPYLKGVLVHSQTLGPVLVAGMLALLCRSLRSTEFRPVEWLWIFPAGACFYLTNARTALVAGALAATACVLYIFFKEGWSYRARLITSVGLATVLLLSWIGAGRVALSGDPSDALDLPLVSDFLLKAKDWDTLVVSREHTVEIQTRAIEHEPVFGHGFGYAPAGLTSGSEVGAFGLPTGQSQELGFVFLAVPMQLGWLGGALFAGTLLVALAKMARAGLDATTGIALVMLGTLIGEMILFSVTGLGCLLWIALGLSAQPVKASKSVAAV